MVTAAPTVSLIPHPGRRRALLLGVVLIGLLTLHLLGRHDSRGGLRMPTGAAVAGEAVAGEAVAGEAASSLAVLTPTPVPMPADGGHLLLTDCALLLLMAAVGGLVAERATSRATNWPAGPRVPGRTRRGPPKVLPRKVLCVERI